MPRIKLSRREWALFLFPCSLLLLTNLNHLPGIDMDRIGMALNPLARARENARSSSCQSNLKQISLGMLQYMHDADGKYPVNATPTQNWVHLILPYTKSCPILHCPSDSSFAGQMVPSYWMNANLNYARGGGLSEKTIDRPARTFLLGDWNASTANSPFTLNEKGWSGKASYSSRHLFGANYAFTDGHVKWFSNDSIAAFQDKAPCCTLHSWKLRGLK